MLHRDFAAFYQEPTGCQPLTNAPTINVYMSVRRIR